MCRPLAELFRAGVASDQAIEGRARCQLAVAMTLLWVMHRRVAHRLTQARTAADEALLREAVDRSTGMARSGVH